LAIPTAQLILTKTRNNKFQYKGEENDKDNREENNQQLDSLASELLDCGTTTIARRAVRPAARQWHARSRGADSLTTSPTGAAIQLFGNNVAPFNGQLYLDSGAHNNAALIFRTARTGGTITERMRIRADGRVSIGAASPSSSATLRVVSNGSRDGVIGEAINGTGVGQFAQAIISSEIKQNRFTIKTNKPQVKVSWQVTGIRQDAYAEAHRIPVEEEKSGEERRHIPAPGSVRPAAREERRARAAANIDAATGTRGEQRNNCRQANSNGPAVRLRRMAR